MANPFVAMNSSQAANYNESLPLFVEYGYDFEKQCFRYDEKRPEPDGDGKRSTQGLDL